MFSISSIPDSAPFNAGQRPWLKEFLAGVLSRSGLPLVSGGGPAAPAPDEKPQILVL